MSKQKHLEKNSLMRLAVFGAATIVFVVLSIVGLTNNSKVAVEKFDTLNAVDAAGGDVEAALSDLREHIYNHMNTRIGNDLGIYPPIQLDDTYNRLVEAERQRVSQINSALEPEAIAFCEAQNPTGFSGRFRLDCIEQYKDENGAKEQIINEDLYKFDFVPPVWSPDLAGFSILFAIVFFFTFLVQLILYLRIRSTIRYGN